MVENMKYKISNGKEIDVKPLTPLTNALFYRETGKSLLVTSVLMFEPKELDKFLKIFTTADDEDIEYIKNNWEDFLSIVALVYSELKKTDIQETLDKLNSSFRE